MWEPRRAPHCASAGPCACADPVPGIIVRPTCDTLRAGTAPAEGTEPSLPRRRVSMRAADSPDVAGAFPLNTAPGSSHATTASTTAKPAAPRDATATSPLSCDTVACSAAKAARGRMLHASVDSRPGIAFGRPADTMAHITTAMHGTAPLVASASRNTPVQNATAPSTSSTARTTAFAVWVCVQGWRGSATGPPAATASCSASSPSEGPSEGPSEAAAPVPATGTASLPAPAPGWASPAEPGGAPASGRRG